VAKPVQAENRDSSSSPEPGYRGVRDSDDSLSPVIGTKKKCPRKVLQDSPGDDGRNNVKDGDGRPGGFSKKSIAGGARRGDSVCN
jgi:hypothetical protein